VTRPDPGDREVSHTADTLAALESLGFTHRDRLRLRFSFEASSHRRAQELAEELRTIMWNVVQVNPEPRRLRSGRPWTVVLRTRPTLLAPAVIGSREDEMRTLARRHSGCRYVGWAPVFDTSVLNRMVLGTDDRPA
jgi:Regulator of ribonuclease activity B